MYTVLIAGAGQLGSRHLQGVKTSLKELDIWVYDLSKESLKVAEERYNQVETNVSKTVHFVSETDLLPLHFDIAIVACSSKPRLAICKLLLAHSVIKFLVLEKFLFTSLSEYDEADKLFKEKGVKVWVNCPRRMFGYYDKINDLLNKNSLINMNFYGKDWGMCCNTIHFVDIFMKLCGEKSFEIDFSSVEPKVIESKRAGYVEFYGTEKFLTPNGNTLSLTCLSETNVENVIKITNGSLNIELFEARQVMKINGSEEAISVRYQSQLSGLVVDSLIEQSSCALATYLESAEFHKTYLKGILNLYNQATGAEHDSCPIT